MPGWMGVGVVMPLLGAVVVGAAAVVVVLTEGECPRMLTQTYTLAQSPEQESPPTWGFHVVNSFTEIPLAAAMAAQLSPELTK